MRGGGTRSSVSAEKQQWWQWNVMLVMEVEQNRTVQNEEKILGVVKIKIKTNNMAAIFNPEKRIQGTAQNNEYPL